MQWWETFKDWFLSLGEKYGVNPYTLDIAATILHRCHARFKDSFS